MYTGKPMYGLDFHREGMFYAMIQRAPFGMKISQVDDSAARGVLGVTNVVTFGSSVAVVGTSTWPLMKAKKMLKISYEPDGVVESTTDHDKLFTDLLAKEWEGECQTKRWRCGFSV